MDGVTLDVKLRTVPSSFNRILSIDGGVVGCRALFVDMLHRLKAHPLRIGDNGGMTAPDSIRKVDDTTNGGSRAVSLLIAACCTQRLFGATVRFAAFRVFHFDPKIARVTPRRHTDA